MFWIARRRDICRTSHLCLHPLSTRGSGSTYTLDSFARLHMLHKLHRCGMLQRGGTSHKIAVRWTPVEPEKMSKDSTPTWEISVHEAIFWCMACMACMACMVSCMSWRLVQCAIARRTTPKGLYRSPAVIGHRHHPSYPVLAHACLCICSSCLLVRSIFLLTMSTTPSTSINNTPEAPEMDTLTSEMIDTVQSPPNTDSDCLRVVLSF